MTARVSIVRLAVASVSSLAFYQAAAGVLAVVLLSGVVAELRSLRGDDSDTAGKRWVEASFYVFVLSCLVVIVGEVTALNVLADPPASDAQQLTVGVAVLAGLVFAPMNAALSVWRRLPGDSGARGRIGAAVAGLGVVAVTFVTYSVIDTNVSGRPGLGSSTVGYRVAGTCANGRCGLNVHSRPRTQARRVGQLRDRDVITIVCQSSGGLVRAEYAPQRSRVWDQLDDGNWVSDLFVTTGGPIGGFDPDLPRCAARPQA
jgi:hypothetical protein